MDCLRRRQMRRQLSVDRFCCLRCTKMVRTLPNEALHLTVRCAAAGERQSVMLLMAFIGGAGRVKATAP